MLYIIKYFSNKKKCTIKYKKNMQTLKNESFTFHYLIIEKEKKQFCTC